MSGMALPKMSPLQFGAVPHFKDGAADVAAPSVKPGTLTKGTTGPFPVNLTPAPIAPTAVGRARGVGWPPAGTMAAPVGAPPITGPVAAAAAAGPPSGPPAYATPAMVARWGAAATGAPPMVYGADGRPATYQGGVGNDLARAQVATAVRGKSFQLSALDQALPGQPGGPKSDASAPVTMQRPMTNYDVKMAAPFFLHPQEQAQHLMVEGINRALQESLGQIDAAQGAGTPQALAARDAAYAARIEQLRRVFNPTANEVWGAQNGVAPTMPTPTLPAGAVDPGDGT